MKNHVHTQREKNTKYHMVFQNDPFTIVYEAFENLFPGRHCLCYWEPEIRPSEDGSKVYGLTDFGEDGTVCVFVDSNITVEDAIEVFAHELAHVAVGAVHDHDDTWEAAFDAIFEEYNRIGALMFPEEEK